MLRRLYEPCLPCRVFYSLQGTAAGKSLGELSDYDVVLSEWSIVIDMSWNLARAADHKAPLKGTALKTSAWRRGRASAAVLSVASERGGEQPDPSSSRRPCPLRRAVGRRRGSEAWPFFFDAEPRARARPRLSAIRWRRTQKSRSRRTLVTVGLGRVGLREVRATYDEAADLARRSVGLLDFLGGTCAAFLPAASLAACACAPDLPRVGLSAFIFAVRLRYLRRERGILVLCGVQLGLEPVALLGSDCGQIAFGLIELDLRSCHNLRSPGPPRRRFHNTHLVASLGPPSFEWRSGRVNRVPANLGSVVASEKGLGIFVLFLCGRGEQRMPVSPRSSERRRTLPEQVWKRG